MYESVTFLLGHPVYTIYVLGPTITPVPPPPRGNFGGYDFLKAYEKCYKMSLVCTLAVGAFGRNGDFKYVTLSLLAFEPYKTNEVIS